MTAANDQTPASPRKILHLDLDAFFCAVEALDNPALQGKPFAVGGRPEQRGVVASCSYEARKFGVRSAMPMAQAVRLCPDLIILPHHRDRYSAVSDEVMRILHDLTPFVEQLSIDEAFMDVTPLAADGADIARQLQAKINTELDLPCSLGVATNKLIAKIANSVGKEEKSRQTDGAPNAIKVVPPGEEVAFLAPLPIRALWGVGPATAARLHDMGITTIGELAGWPEQDLIDRFGAHGAALSRHARGTDDRPVQASHAAHSISAEITFEQDLRDSRQLRHALRRLAERVGRRTRREGLGGSTIKLKLRWADFTTLTRQSTLPHRTDQDDEIFAAAEALLLQLWAEGTPVRLIGVGIANLGEPFRQLSLWDDPAEIAERRRLQAALDRLRQQYGRDIIMRGSDLQRQQRRKRKK
ncbi:MAG: DNA polymerase IV [Anaerolineae bacterium]